MTIKKSLILVNVNSWTLKKTMKMSYLPIVKSDLKKNYYEETPWYYNTRASQFQRTFNKCMLEC